MCRFNNSYIFDCSKLRNNNPANVEFLKNFIPLQIQKRQCFMR